MKASRDLKAGEEITAPYNAGADPYTFFHVFGFHLAQDYHAVPDSQRCEGILVDQLPAAQNGVAANFADFSKKFCGEAYYIGGGTGWLMGMGDRFQTTVLSGVSRRKLQLSIWSYAQQSCRTRICGEMSCRICGVSFRRICICLDRNS